MGHLAFDTLQYASYYQTWAHVLLEQNACSSIMGKISNLRVIGAFGDLHLGGEVIEVSVRNMTWARFTNFQELFLTRILNAIVNRLRIDS
jgi:hypothetical protein